MGRSERRRSGLDHEKMALNEQHFLPHGGFYFGAPDGGGKVVRAQIKSGEKNLREQVQSRYDEANKRHW